MLESKTASTIKLLIILFILFAIFNNNGQKIKSFISKAYNSLTQIERLFFPIEDDAKKNPANSSSTSSVKNTESNLIIGNKNSSYIGNQLTNIFNQLLENPNFAALVEKVIEKSIEKQGAIIENDPAFNRIITHDAKNGRGKKANCGDTVKIKYNIYNKAELEANPKLATLPLKETIINIGENRLHLGIENALIGMEENGHRKAIFLNDLSANTLSTIKEKQISNFMIAEIKLVQVIKSKNKANLIVHSTRNAKPGASKPLCGESIKFYYQIRNINGKILYDSIKNKRQVNITPGYFAPSEINQTLISTPSNNLNITIIATPNQIISAFNKKNLFFPKKIASDNVILLYLDAIQSSQP